MALRQMALGPPGGFSEQRLEVDLHTTEQRQSRLMGPNVKVAALDFVEYLQCAVPPPLEGKPPQPRQLTNQALPLP